MAGTIPPASASSPGLGLPGYRGSDAPPLAPGDVIASSYQVRELLARAETGAVFAAWDMQLEREVALKIGWRDPGMPGLLGEARWCQAIRDPSSVAVLHLGQHGGLPYAVVERAPRHVVRGQLTPGGLTAPRVLERAATAVAGMVAAHDAGLAVGELSGETVAMDEHGRLVFGRSSMSQVPSQGAHGRSLAPETIVGGVSASDPNAAAAIDLYGLGCFIYELATGLAPFGALGLPELLHGHGHLPMPRIDGLRSDLPTELSDLVDELCAKAPGMRPVSADLVREQLAVIAHRAAAGAAPLRVMIVDDDAGRAARLRSLVHRALARAVTAVSGGADAVARLRRDLPDLVFVDARLGPGSSTLEVCVGVAAVPELAGARLVLVADEVSDRDRTMIASMGVRDVVVRGERLADRVIELTRGTGRSRRATARKMISG
jgi:CheY-like chemotaxis protein